MGLHMGHSTVTDFQTIFKNIESTLVRTGNQSSAGDDMEQRLGKYKLVVAQTFTDAEYFRKLVHIVFLSGFRTETVVRKLPVIDGFLSDYATVAGYGPANLQAMMAHPGMIRNKLKIQGCIDNAKKFQSIVEKHGSFQMYIYSQDPQASFVNMMRLRRDLRRFAYIRKVTSLHFLMDIGLPVLKPDRVVCRIFYRLGLLDSESGNEDQLLKAVEVGRQFALATGHSIRYIDAVFVAYGQVTSTGTNIQQGICLKNNPRCDICGVTKYCDYFGKDRRDIEADLGATTNLDQNPASVKAVQASWHHCRILNHTVRR